MITQKNEIFSYFTKLYESWGNFQSSYGTKKYFLKQITNLILDEVIISDRHMSNGQKYSFLQRFFKTEKIRLN